MSSNIDRNGKVKKNKAKAFLTGIGVLGFTAMSFLVGGSSADWVDSQSTSSVLDTSSFDFRTAAWWGEEVDPNWGMKSTPFLRDRAGASLGWDWTVPLSAGGRVGLSQNFRALTNEGTHTEYTLDEEAISVRHTLAQTPEWLSWAVYRAGSETCLRNNQTLADRPDLLLASGDTLDDFTPGEQVYTTTARISLCLVFDVDENATNLPQAPFTVYLDTNGRSTETKGTGWRDEVEGYATIQMN